MSVKGVQSFIGMVNYYNYYQRVIKSSYPFNSTHQENATQKGFEMTQQARDEFFPVKDLLANSAQLVIMNEEDPLLLYTDASTKAIGGILMQVQNGIEIPVIFILISCLRSSDSLGNHGARALFFRLLCAPA